jgi:CRISPR-associated protein Cas5t
LLNEPAESVVLRTLWQIKKHDLPQGHGSNAAPDFQQLLVGAELVVFCDSGDEPEPSAGLETRVIRAMRTPESVDRFGGWSLGESTHLINDASLLDGAIPPADCLAFMAHTNGTITMPVWVDHVGSAGSIYAVGRMERLRIAPIATRLPQVPFAASPVII